MNKERKEGNEIRGCIISFWEATSNGAREDCNIFLNILLHLYPLEMYIMYLYIPTMMQ